MFERYTEKARRAIFFARYEASQYGSASIETEHLLLGLLREDRAFARQLVGYGVALEKIRAEIERHIVLRERIPTSVEMPLAEDGKKALYFASEEAENLGHSYIGTEHILLGLLRAEGSLASQLLLARGVKVEVVRAAIAQAPEAERTTPPQRNDHAKLTLETFLAELKWKNAADLIDAFAQNAQFVDVFGRRWDREGISKSFETLFAPYAKKNATPSVDEILADEADLFVASVIWKNAVVASMERVWIHRMSVVLIRDREAWRILLIQATALQPLQA